jgi:hypothetical protein
MRGIAAVAASLWLLMGCASPTWVKTVDSMYPGDANAARYECERDVRQSGYYGPGLIGVFNARSFYGQCMRAKGFYEQAPTP